MQCGIMTNVTPFEPEWEGDNGGPLQLLKERTMTRHRVLTRRAAFVLVFIAFVFTPAGAQQRENAARPRWADLYPPNLLHPTAAERAAAMTTLDEIQRVLEQVPELGKARGFELERHIFGGTLSFGERGVLTYSWFLVFYRESKAVPQEPPLCIEVHVNASRGALIDETGKAFFIEQVIGEPIPGATIVYEGLRWDTPTADRRPGYVTLTSRGAFPWLPVSREEYLRALIYLEEGKNGEKEKEFRKSLEKTSYERYMEEAGERKKIRDESLASMARAQGRAAAEELRKSLEQTEREVAEQLKAAEAEERKQFKEALTNRYGDQLRAQLAAMTPTERAAPATARYGDRQLVAPDDPEAHRVLTPDPEFWRSRRSRAEVHSITISFHPGGTCAFPPIRAALEKAYQTLDWAALKRIVDRPW